MYDTDHVKHPLDDARITKHMTRMDCGLLRAAIAVDVHTKELLQDLCDCRSVQMLAVLE